jgi:hypothetical protein
MSGKGCKSRGILLTIVVLHYWFLIPLSAVTDYWSDSLHPGCVFLNTNFFHFLVCLLLSCSAKSVTCPLSYVVHDRHLTCLCSNIT